MSDKAPASRAWKKLVRDKIGLASLVIIGVYILVAVLAQLGLIAQNYAQSMGEAYSNPLKDGFLLGTDYLGRPVLQRVAHGTRVAILVGFISIAISIPIGIFFGSLAGYFRGVVDDFIVWLYSTFDSIPGILMLLSLAFLLGKGLIPICIAIGITSWVSTCRIVRGEFIKQSGLEYVQAEKALGAGHLRIIYRHILPNVMHLVLIQASLIFVYAVKSEVILNYLGLGDPNWPSWGIIISDARLELIGRKVWWPFVSATAAMFVLLLAFNMFNDALRDALDPKTMEK